MELLFALYSTEFFWIVSRDRNRAEDGLELREKFEYETGEYADISGPCNCLELFVAMAIRCESDLMYDPDYGDRTGQWFWMFLNNLGLLAYDSDTFNYDEVDDILYHFMNREYGPDGEYCAFYSSDSDGYFDKKFKKMELAYQMNYFIKDKYHYQFF